MSSYHVDLDARLDHTLDADELDDLLSALHPYGAALSGGIDERLSVSMTIATDNHGPQEATAALEQALRALGGQVQVLTVDQAQVSTEHAKDTQIKDDPRALPHLISVLEVAEQLGVSRQRARTILQTDPAAPIVALQTSLGELYREADIRAWVSTRGQPRPGRRSQEDLEEEASGRARRSLILAGEEIQRRTEDPTAAAEPITLRIHTQHLAPAEVTRTTAAARELNDRGERHRVQVLLVDGLTEEREVRRSLQENAASMTVGPVREAEARACT